MLIDLLHSSYFSLFLIVALGFMLGRIKIGTFIKYYKISQLIHTQSIAN